MSPLPDRWTTPRNRQPGGVRSAERAASLLLPVPLVGLYHAAPATAFAPEFNPDAADPVSNPERNPTAQSSRNA